jgi:hypothetical protein
MTTMNEHIWDSPGEFPAAAGLNRAAIEQAAMTAATDLLAKGWSTTALQPDDGTVYRMTIQRSLVGAPFLVASSFGPTAWWDGKVGIHPDYAEAKYVGDRHFWTATVFALFLNSVGSCLDGRVAAPPAGREFRSHNPSLGGGPFELRLDGMDYEIVMNALEDVSAADLKETASDLRKALNEWNHVDQQKEANE